MAGTWLEFVEELDRHILPVYLAHERSFDEPGIHGRMHICRCILFAEFMGQHYRRETALQPIVDDVRYAVAFHDAGRRANGPDFWEHESVALLVEYLRRDPARTSRNPDEMGALLAAKSDPAPDIEARIVHDADVLDIMRPCCGHGGRAGFWEEALIFLGEKDDPRARNPKVRADLIEQAWEFIRVSEERKPALEKSADYMVDVLDVLAGLRQQCPVLADTLLESSVAQ